MTSKMTSKAAVSAAAAVAVKTIGTRLVKGGWHDVLDQAALAVEMAVRTNLAAVFCQTAGKSNENEGRQRRREDAIHLSYSPPCTGADT